MTDDASQTIFQGLQNNTLFDSSSLSNAQQFSLFLNSLSTVLNNDPTLAPYVNQINSLSVGQLNDLENHLTDHFANIITNLGVTDSYISNSSNYGLTNNLSSNDYFASITGKSDTLVGQSLKQVNQLLGTVSASAATGIKIG